MNGLNIAGLKIDNDCLGKDMMLTTVKPYYAYADGKRTDCVQGYKYTVALPAQHFALLNVKIEGTKQMDAPTSGYKSVQFVGLNAKLYFDNNNRVQVSAKASGIRMAGQH